MKVEAYRRDRSTQRAPFPHPTANASVLDYTFKFKKPVQPVPSNEALCHSPITMFPVLVC